MVLGGTLNGWPNFVYELGDAPNPLALIADAWHPIEQMVLHLSS